MPGTPRSLEMGIVVDDLDRMTAFYRDALGCRHIVDREAPIGVMRRLRCGDAQIKLLKHKVPSTGSNPGGGPRADCTGYRWFSITIENDLEETLARCETHGGRVVSPISGTYVDGPRYMVIEDPENNWFEVLDGDLDYDKF